MKKAFQIIASAAVLALSASASYATTSTSLCDSNAQNLVANCGFETGDFTSWAVSGNDVPLSQGPNGLYGVESGVDPLDGISPNSGQYQAFFADLAPNATTISQPLATTAGATYQISFYLSLDTQGSGPVTGENSTIETVMFGGTTLVNQLNGAPTNGYALYSFEATATSASTTLSLTLGGGQVGQFLLDDVSVTAVSAVPEPSTPGLLAAGLVGVLGVVGRRRRKA